MFLKPANSDTEMVLKVLKISLKNIHVQQKLENWKRHFLKFTRITKSLGSYLIKINNFYTVFH